MAGVIALLVPAFVISASMGGAAGLEVRAAKNELRAAVKQMYTDPLHLQVSAPGHLEGNVAFLPSSILSKRMSAGLKK